MTVDKDDTFAESDKDIYEEARDFLKRVEDFESENRANGLEALKFRRGDPGDQWEDCLLYTSPSPRD